MEIHINLSIGIRPMCRGSCEWQPTPFGLEMATCGNKSVIDGFTMGIVKDEYRVSVIIGFGVCVRVPPVGTDQVGVRYRRRAVLVLHIDR